MGKHIPNDFAVSPSGDMLYLLNKIAKDKLVVMKVEGIECVILREDKTLTHTLLVMKHAGELSKYNSAGSHVLVIHHKVYGVYEMSHLTVDQAEEYVHKVSEAMAKVSGRQRNTKC